MRNDDTLELAKKLRGMVLPRGYNTAVLIQAARTLEWLAEEDQSSHELILRQSKLLRNTAEALRGTPPPNVSWSHHDLPELARELRAERDRLHEFARFVIRGVESGTVKSKPIITDDPNAAQLEMKSLAQVAREALGAKR